MWPSHHWECQAHLALWQLPSESSGQWLGHALGVLCHPGTSAPLTGCSLLCTARASRLLFHICSGTEARRDWTEEEQEKEVTFFGKKVHVSGLASEGTILHILTGIGCWVSSGHTKLPAALLAMEQAPEAVPRKNPVRGRIGKQKLVGKGIGNDT